jgi:hypothetical protein
VGFSILQIKATDGDSGRNGQVRFEITQELQGSRLVGSPSNRLFAIDGSTGVVELRRSLCTVALLKLDRVVLFVQATDGGAVGLGNLTTVAVRLVEANTAPPRFVKAVYDAVVPENTERGTTVVDTEAHDDDEGECGYKGQLAYSLVSQSTPGTFRVEERTGKLISRVTLSTAVARVHTVNISVSDGGRPAARHGWTTVLVTVASDYYGELAAYPRGGVGFLQGDMSVDPDEGYSIAQDFGFFRNGASGDTGAITAAWGR